MVLVSIVYKTMCFHCH